MTETRDLRSALFFPLRTNVEYFGTPEEFLSLEGRIKQATVLYERVVLQAGLYTASLGADGAIGMYLSPSQLPSIEELREIQRRQSQSGSFSLAVQTDPAKPFQPLFSHAIERQLLSCFHLLLDSLPADLAIHGLEISDVRLSDEGKQRATHLAQEYLATEDAILPHGSRRVQEHIAMDFFKDLLLVSSLRCVSSVDPLHAPILNQIVRRGPAVEIAPGFSSLEFLVPHCANLPWAQVAKFRQDPAAVEFRQRLRQAEKTVRDMLPEATEQEIQLEVGRILTRELVSELTQRMPAGPGEVAGRVVLQVAGGVVSEALPFVGIIDTAVSVGKDVADWNRERKTWLTALMKLSRID